MPLLEAFLARAQGSDVRLTMVDGRILYDHGKFPHLDLSQIEQAAVRSACNARRPRVLANRDRTAELSVHLHRHYRAIGARHARSKPSDSRG
jgi:hypothetical protein